MQEINVKLSNILFFKFKNIKIKYICGNNQYTIIEFEKPKDFSFTKTTYNTDIDYLAFRRRKNILIKDQKCIHPLNLFLLNRLFI